MLDKLGAPTLGSLFKTPVERRLWKENPGLNATVGKLSKPIWRVSLVIMMHNEKAHEKKIGGEEEQEEEEAMLVNGPSNKCIMNIKSTR